jgi:hypothetical protein
MFEQFINLLSASAAITSLIRQHGLKYNKLYYFTGSVVALDVCVLVRFERTVAKCAHFER